QPTWTRCSVAFAAEYDFARPEDRSRDWQLQQVGLTCHRERDVRWCAHANVMTFGDVVSRHEAIEEWILTFRRRTRRLPVSEPGDPGIGGIGASGGAKADCYPS